jgi:hypothetical protein
MIRQTFSPKYDLEILFGPLNHHETDAESKDKCGLFSNPMLDVRLKEQSINS